MILLQYTGAAGQSSDALVKLTTRESCGKTIDHAAKFRILVARASAVRGNSSMIILYFCVSNDSGGLTFNASTFVCTR